MGHNLTPDVQAASAVRRPRTTLEIERKWWGSWMVDYAKQHPAREYVVSANVCYAMSFYQDFAAQQWEAWTLWVADKRIKGEL